MKNDIKYKILAIEFTKMNSIFTQVKRVGDIAIYSRKHANKAWSKGHHEEGFEVVLIARHNGYEMGGVTFEPSETYPSTTQWGTKAWTFRFNDGKDLHRAEKKFNELLEKVKKGELKLQDELAEVEED